MEIPLQVTLRDVRRSEVLEERIRDNAARLERLHPDITSCAVVVEREGGHHVQGRQFAVRVEVRLPGLTEPLVSSQHHHEDAHVALRDAFAATLGQVDRAEGTREARRKEA